MLTVGREQREQLESAETKRFHRSLFAYLRESFPEYSDSQAQGLFSECLAYARGEGISTEYGLTSLTTISFLSGSCIEADGDYRALHEKCLAETGDPEAAVNAIYEGLY